jgi:uncharacterized protein YneF (UPF0154 family)
MMILGVFKSRLWENKMKKPESSLAITLIICVSILVICFGGLVIGIKLEYPAANIAIPMPVVVLTVLWCSILLAYYAAIDTVSRQLGEEPAPKEEQNESVWEAAGDTPILSNRFVDKRLVD